MQATTGLASWFRFWGGLRLEFVDFLRDSGKEGGEGGFFLGSEAAKNEIDVAEFLAEFVVPGAEAETRKVSRMEVFGDGFEAVVAAAAAFGAIAKTVEGQVKIVADDKDVFEGDFVEIGKVDDGAAGIVVESLGFDEDFVAVF